MIKHNIKLIILAAILFAAVLIVRVVPMVNGYYQQRVEEVSRLEERIERYLSLQEQLPSLKERESNIVEESAQLAAGLFNGNTPNLIGSNVQRELRRVTTVANVNVREMKVSDFVEVDGWIMVSQDMTFTINQSDMLMFLNLLEEARPKLHVTKFSIDRARRQFNGSLTVTAFSRDPQSSSQG